METFYSSEERVTFYGVCTQPPAIIEFDYSNLDNVLITKIFSVQLMFEKIYGHVNIAVN
jgi:hypothetical protein